MAAAVLKKDLCKHQTLHTKMHYKMAIGDIIKLSGIFVFWDQRNRWNFELLAKARGLGTPPGIPGRQPAPRGAPPARPSRGGGGGDESLGPPLPFPPHIPSSL